MASLAPWRICSALLLFVSLALGSAIVTRRSLLLSCLDAANVTHLDPQSPNWAGQTQSFNLRLTYVPVAVAVPTSARDVQAAVRCGVRNGVHVTAKGGGHSFASFGLGGENGHLVVDFHTMETVKLNKDNTATVQPGARLGHVATQLYKQGKRAIAHGSCVGVGIAGHVLHGGMGLSVRTRGLALDWLIGADVVLANGTLVKASKTENSDLFWALRGAGSSFGIVTEYRFDTFAAPTAVTTFTIYANWNRSSAAAGVAAYQELAKTAPKELDLYLIMEEGLQTMEGAWYGDYDAVDALIAPLIHSPNSKYVKANATVGWLESLEFGGSGLAGGNSLDQTYPYTAHQDFYTTSLMTPEISNTQIRSLVDSVWATASNMFAPSGWSVILEMPGGPHSQVSQTPADATAYAHRDKLLLYQFTIQRSTFTARDFNLMAQFRESVTAGMPDGSWGMYPNYPDTQLDRATAERLYWAQHLPRLRELKTKFDPRDLFYFPQGVQPA